MNAWRIWWRSTGSWGYVLGALCLLALLLFTLFRPHSKDWVAHGSRSLGATRLVLHSRGPVREGGQMALRLRADRAIELAIGINAIAKTVALEPGLPGEFLLPVPDKTPVLHLLVDAQGERLEWYLGRLLFSAAPGT